MSINFGSFFAKESSEGAIFKQNHSISSYFYENQNLLFDKNPENKGRFLDTDDDGKLDTRVFYIRDENKNITGGKFYTVNSDEEATINFSFKNGLLSEVNIDGDFDGCKTFENNSNYKQIFKYENDSDNSDTFTLSSEEIYFNKTDLGDKEIIKTEYSQDGKIEKITRREEYNKELEEMETYNFDNNGILKDSEGFEKFTSDHYYRNTQFRKKYDENGNIINSRVVDYNKKGQKTNTYETMNKYDENNIKRNSTFIEFYSDDTLNSITKSEYNDEGKITKSVRSKAWGEQGLGEQMYTTTFYDEFEAPKYRIDNLYNRFGQLKRSDEEELIPYNQFG